VTTSCFPKQVELIHLPRYMKVLETFCSCFPYRRVVDMLSWSILSYYPIICLEGVRMLVTIASLRAEIRTQDFPKTMQDF